MKKFVIVLMGLSAMLFIATTTEAQTFNPYQKGNLHYSITQDMGIKFHGARYDGKKENSTIKSGISLRGEYFVIKNLAAGIGFERQRERYKDDFKEVLSQNMIKLNVLYGRSFGNINLQARGVIGLGTWKEYWEIDGYESKSNAFRWELEIESPINISGGCNGYLTPGIGYGTSKWTWDGGWEKYGDFYFKADLTFFIPPSDHYSDIKKKCSGEKTRYLKGSVALGASSPFKLKFGHYKSSHAYEGEREEEHTEEKTYNEVELFVNGYYYIIDNLGIGGEVIIDTYKNKSKNTDDDHFNSTAGTDIIIMPAARYNLPLKGCLHNTFVNTGVGFGTDNWKTEDSYDEYTDNKKLITFYAGAGYDYYFLDFLALVPRIGYRLYSYNNKQQDYKYNDGWIELEIGLTFFIWPKGSTRYFPSDD